MGELKLVRPSPDMEAAVWEYRQEFFDHGETHVNGSLGMSHYADYKTWLHDVLAIEKDAVNDDGVHASTFLSVREGDGRIIGTIQLRHSLTPALEEDGGHIGYAIRPTERGRGYGREQLSLVLDVARKMGIPRVMISCDKTNRASAATAMSMGGVLARENVIEGVPQEIYWVEL